MNCHDELHYAADRSEREDQSKLVPARQQVYSKSTTNMIGDLSGFGAVWYYEKGIANVLLLAKVAKMFKVTYNSSDGQGFVIHKPDGTSCCFKRSSCRPFLLCDEQAGDGVSEHSRSK
eukprot:3993788-Ditylum_brightwellii.AAC.1